MIENDTLLAVDPGLNCTGWALFGRGKLGFCGYLTSSRENTLGERLLEVSPHHIRSHFLPAVGKAVIEIPQIYGGGNARAPGGDLIKVALVAGAWAEFIGPQVDFIFPRQWKGQVPKGVMLERILSRLSDAERSTLPRGKVSATSRIANTIDAIGLGLWAVGRL